jgi:hypothetical protein
MLLFAVFVQGLSDQEVLRSLERHLESTGRSTPGRLLLLRASLGQTRTCLRKWVVLYYSVLFADVCCGRETRRITVLLKQVNV